MWDVFHRPLALMAASVALLLLARRYLWAGASWIEVLAAAGVFAPLYSACAFRLVVQPQHQAWLIGTVRAVIGKVRAAIARRGPAGSL